MKLTLVAMTALLTVVAMTQEYKPKAGETIVKMTIEKKGDIYISLGTKEAPKTTENFIKLVNQKFYDGILFHRVVAGFVAQAGDPQTKTKGATGEGIGNGGPGWTIKFENTPLKHEKYALGMARTQDPDSAGSQFYICLEPAHRLDGNYVVFGKVVSGMALVDKLAVGDKIVSARLIQDGRK